MRRSARYIKYILLLAAAAAAVIHNACIKAGLVLKAPDVEPFTVLGLPEREVSSVDSITRIHSLQYIQAAVEAGTDSHIIYDRQTDRHTLICSVYGRNRCGL